MSSLRDRLMLRIALAALALFAAACLAAIHAAPALAASADISVSADNPPPVPSGQAATYTINFTCSAVVGNSCGPNPTITIPLAAAGASPIPDPTTWAYGSVSNISGLVTSTQVVGNNLVIKLNNANLQAGQSDTIQLSVTPPNNLTPNGTTYQIEPSFQTDDIPKVDAPTPAQGGASATSHPIVTKATSDGSAVYVAGNTVTYNISARCNSGSTGNLFYTSGSLVDPLPAGLTFVSATPTPTTSPAVGASGQITWDYPTAASLPSGCGQGANATQTYTIVAQIPAGTPDNTILTNSATFGGVPIGQTTPQTTTATAPVRAISTPPASPGAFIDKSGLGPLSITNGPNPIFDATYAGNWITPIATQPSTSPGSAEGMYTVTIRYPASRAFQTDLADPVPCLDNQIAAGEYSSITPSGAIDTDTSIRPLCQNPAFNPTAVRVSSASLAAAVNGAAAWRPIAIRPDGTTFQLTRVGTVGTSTYFDVPTAPTNEIGRVAAIELPQNSNLTDVTMSMNVWGYGDPSLKSADDLHDVATATAYPVGGGTSTTQSHAADIFIQPSRTQLGVLKAFGALKSGPGGTTPLNLTGSVQTAAALTGDVVMTDLLPAGLSWANPPARGTASFSVTKGRGGTATAVTGTTEDLPNYQNTGRELIRITLPKSAFTSGYYTITPPTNLIDLTVPTAATTYNNTAQLFVKGIGQNTLPTCGPGTTTTPATFESSDPLDLDGDGATNENYCQWGASLTVTPSGPPAFAVVKTVQGDQDAAPKFSPGVGDASQGGTGVYTLTWTSTGGSALKTPVLYDILPYVGDVGVSGGQSTVKRDSEFAPTFAALTAPLPANVTVQYSTSTNPCRPEVFPDSGNPACVNDWSATPPADPATVKALRFASTATYAPGTGFAVSFRVNVPPQFVNVIAWNSAAADANVASSGAALLPAEGPKVGLTAPAPSLTPTVVTTASATSVSPGDSFSDSVDIANTGGAGGTLTWHLLGPVAPDANGTCDNADWSGAAEADAGTVAVAGNGTYRTAVSSPTGAGCYGYADELDGGHWAARVMIPAGTPGESVLVKPATLTTTASAIRIRPGDNLTDSIALSGAQSSSGATAAGTISWRLVGPVAAGADGTCAALDWSGAPTADSGTIPVSGDGSYTTSGSAPTAEGCYSYVDSLDAPAPGAPAASVAGAPGETVLVAIPSVSTAVSAPTVLAGDQVNDSIEVHGTAGQPGTITWKLLGPAAAAGNGSCAGAAFKGAKTVATGTLPVTGDGAYTTPNATLADGGCYGYEVTLSGDSYGGDVVSAAGTTGEVVQSKPQTAKQRIVHLAVVKTVNQHVATFGEPLTYTLTATNSGPDTATDVKVTDTPVSPMRLVSVKSPGGTCGQKFPVVCTIGSLRAGHKWTVTVVAVPLTVGDVGNGVHITTPDTNTSPPAGVVSHTHTKVKATLKLGMKVKLRRVHAGGKDGFVVTVKNPTKAAAKAGRVCVRLPRGLVYVSASVKAKISSGRVCFAFASIAPHGHRQATVIVRALPGSHGKLVAHATLTGSAIVKRVTAASVHVIPKPPKVTPVTG